MLITGAVINTSKIKTLNVDKAPSYQHKNILLLIVLLTSFFQFKTMILFTISI